MGQIGHKSPRIAFNGNKWEWTAPVGLSMIGSAIKGHARARFHAFNEWLAASEMKPPLVPHGIGRVVFVARLATIKREIEAGDYLTTVYARHSDALGITYSAFRKLVARYAPEAKPVRQPYGSASAPPANAKPTLPVSEASTPSSSAPAARNLSHARHEPDTRPTFVHDGRTKEGEAERLFGPGYLPGSRK